jgi:PKD repeat protein
MRHSTDRILAFATATAFLALATAGSPPETTNRGTTSDQPAGAATLAAEVLPLPIVRTLSPKDVGRYGLEFAENHLYVGNPGYGPDHVQKVDPATGTIVQIYDLSFGDWSGGGLAWDGTNFFVADLEDNDLFVTDKSFSLVRELKLSQWQNNDDLAFDGTHLWVATASKIWRVDRTNGTLISSFTPPCKRPSGLAWDGTHLWLANGDFIGDEDFIYKLDTGGNVLAQYKGPGKWATGLAFDGQFLWCLDFFEQIFQLDIGFAGTVTSVEPAVGPSTGGTTVTIRGKGFVDVGGVTFGGAPAQNVQLVSMTEIRAITPPHTEGVVDVVVQRSSGAQATLPQAFRYFTALAASAGADVTAGTPPLQVQLSGGDGAAPVHEQNPQHTYTSLGTVQATLTVVDSDGASASASVPISVTGEPVFRYLIPSVAHTSGLAGTLWRTDIAAVNRASTAASISLTYYSGSVRTLILEPLAAGATVEWGNILETVVGIAPSANSTGSLEISSTTPLFVTSRTYNQTPTGTYGQYYPALTEADALSAGTVGVLPHLKKASDYRTNIGIINLGNTTCTGVFKLFDTTGTQVGNPQTVTVDSRKWKQVNDIFPLAGAGNQTIAYATLEIQTANGKVWAYASVIDAATGDPTTIPILASDSAPSSTAAVLEQRAVPTSAWIRFSDFESSSASDRRQTSGDWAAANKYAGSWSGTTNGSLPVLFHVNDSGVVDNLTIDLKLRAGGHTCTYEAQSLGSPVLSGSSLSVPVAVLGTGISSTVSGTFSSTSSISGTFTGYHGQFSLTCGGSYTTGIGSPLESGTWQASKAAPLVISASANVTSGQAPLDVSFTGSASGGVSPRAYSWNFGDGSSGSSSQSPVHRYVREGSFDVVLTVTDAAGARAQATTRIAVAPPAALVATASADTTGGQAPLPVHFTGAAAGGISPYTYSWNFADGSSPSTTQNPTHIYNTGGTFAVVLTVTDSVATVATGTVTIAVTPPPNLTAAATASVTRGELPLTSQFSGGASGGIPPHTYSWDFGDGSPATTTQNPTHTYVRVGTFTVTLTVRDSVGKSALDNHIAVTVLEPTIRYRYLVPSVAHAIGSGGTRWRTDIAIVNRSGLPAGMKVSFYPYSGGSPVSHFTTLQSGATVEWRDVLVERFSLGSSASNKGTVHVDSNVPLFITARTYNQTANGTYGQYYPAMTPGQGLASGLVGVLPQLKRTDDYRTNVGILNLGDLTCTAKILLHNAQGNVVGTVTLTADPGRYIQSDDPFRIGGAGMQEIAYATVEVQTTGGQIWAYASVIDNATGDATTIPVLSR